MHVYSECYLLTIGNRKTYSSQQQINQFDDYDYDRQLITVCVSRKAESQNETTIVKKILWE